MASVCAKCGAEVSPDKQLCAACDTPAPAAAAAVAPAQPVAPPAKSTTSAVKIVLIVVAIFVGLGILGVGAFGFMVWRVSRAVHVSGPGNQVTMNLPGGSYTANPSKTYTAAELGTDIYPGATPGHGGMTMDLPTGSMVTAVFLTSDSKEQVLEFYKTAFGSGASVFDTSDGAVLTLQKSQQESVVVTITAKPSENDGKTQIVIVHTTSTKSS
jgi:nitrate reductase NapE component